MKKEIIYLVQYAIYSKQFSSLFAARTFAKKLFETNIFLYLEDVEIIREIDGITRKRFKVFIPYEVKKEQKILAREFEFVNKKKADQLSSNRL